jgi:hypothetical protein
VTRPGHSKAAAGLDGFFKGTEGELFGKLFGARSRARKKGR